MFKQIIQTKQKRNLNSNYLLDPLNSNVPAKVVQKVQLRNQGVNESRALINGKGSTDKGFVGGEVIQRKRFPINFNKNSVVQRVLNENSKLSEIMSTEAGDNIETVGNAPHTTLHGANINELRRTWHHIYPKGNTSLQKYIVPLSKLLKGITDKKLDMVDDFKSIPGAVETKKKYIGIQKNGQFKGASGHQNYYWNYNNGFGGPPPENRSDDPGQGIERKNPVHMNNEQYQNVIKFGESMENINNSLVNSDKKFKAVKVDVYNGLNEIPELEHKEDNFHINDDNWVQSAGKYKLR